MKKVVFDLDDTLWALNKRACEMANVDYNKIDTFKLTENKLLTDEEKSRMLKIYNSIDLWKNIKWEDGVTDLMSLKQFGAKVYINSNCLNQEVADFKRSFLHKELGIPDDQIILNIMTDVKVKPLDNDMYIFIDDSPYNINNSKAKYNIIPNRPWNKSVEGYRCNTLKEIIELCKSLLNEES